MQQNGGDDDESNNTPHEGETTRELHDVSLSLDAILSLLAHHQRRDLISHLIEAPDQTATLDECIIHLMERGEKRTGTRPSHDQIGTALHHVHIPKLVDSGICEYDPRSQELRYWGHDRLEDWLNRIQADESEPD